MFREQKSNRRQLGVQEIEGVLRHPDGSVDIAAYTKLAHRERAAAIAAAAVEAVRRVRGMLWATGMGLAPVARSEAASARHHGPVGR